MGSAVCKNEFNIAVKRSLIINGNLKYIRGQNNIFGALFNGKVDILLCVFG